MNQKKERTELDLFFDNLAIKWLEFSWPDNFRLQVTFLTVMKDQKVQVINFHL